MSQNCNQILPECQFRLNDLKEDMHSMLDKLSSIDDAIRGNGQPGLKEIVRGLEDWKNSVDAETKMWSNRKWQLLVKIGLPLTLFLQVVIVLLKFVIN
jgi:hypothetical protein